MHVEYCEQFNIYIIAVINSVGTIFNDPPAIVYIASWLTLSSGVYFLFDKSEDVITDERRRSIAKWLNGTKSVDPINNWPADFAKSFDDIFGLSILSSQRLMRSCVASIIAITSFLLISASLDWSAFKEILLFNLNYHNMEQLSFYVYDLLTMTIIGSLVPDYISLVETRLVLRWMERTSSSIMHIAYLVLDLALTAFISVCGLLFYLIMRFYLVPLIIDHLIPSASLVWRTSFESWDDLFDFWNRCLPKFVTLKGGTGAWFFGSFVTSIWLWLYALSGTTAILLNRAGRIVSGFMSILDTENKPLRSLGLIAVIIVTLIYIAIPIVRIIL